VNEKARTTVYRAIIECLIRNREWYDAYPSSVYEWKDLLNRNLPWSWRLLDKEKESEKEEPASSQEAELVFKDELGSYVMVNLLTFDGRELSLTNGYDAPQWLVMKPIYCIAIGVTKEVRVACDSFISHGANYVEFVRQKLRGKAVIDVDLLQERITVVGEEAELARKKLQYFAANRWVSEMLWFM
ncbi:hypothetical protein OSTOST_13394, partial [Ostertagia ostertagi]